MRRIIDATNSRLDAVANTVGLLLASRWTILAFALVSLSALPQAIANLVGRGDLAGLVGWFSQNFVQLVALAVLAFLSDRQERLASDRNAKMYDWLLELHESLHGKLDALHDKVDAVGSDK